MATKPDIESRIAADCAGAKGPFAVTLLDLGTDGCTAHAESGWESEDDFVQLTIAGTLLMNGCVTAHDGALAQIRFYGQIHPAALEKLLAS